MFARIAGLAVSAVALYVLAGCGGGHSCKEDCPSVAGTYSATIDAADPGAKDDKCAGITGRSITLDGVNVAQDADKLTLSGFLSQTLTGTVFSNGGANFPGVEFNFSTGETATASLTGTFGGAPPARTFRGNIEVRYQECSFQVPTSWKQTSAP